MNRKVFLSFAIEDKSLVDKFRMQAQEQSLPLDFRDYSVKDTFDKSWKSQAEKIIHGSSVTLCFVEKLPVPRALREHSITPLRWNLQEIMQAIENAAT